MRTRNFLFVAALLLANSGVVADDEPDIDDMEPDIQDEGEDASIALQQAEAARAAQEAAEAAARAAHEDEAARAAEEAAAAAAAAAEEARMAAVTEAARERLAAEMAAEEAAAAEAVAAAAAAEESEPELPEDDSSGCIKIEESPLPDDDKFFHFKQNDERLDPNQFVKVVFKIMSSHKVGLVQKVMLDFNPRVKKEVGPYSMMASVTALKAGKAEEKCYEIIITVLDTDECTYDGALPEWKHNCDASTQCVNTQGSYFCACNDGDFAVPQSGGGKCQNEANSLECCGAENKECHVSFQCHSDHCAFNDCHTDATCIPGTGANDFTCECNSGFFDRSADKGRGYSCEATDHCANDKCPQGCTCLSVTNATHNGYYCNPMDSSFVEYHPSSEDEWETPPVEDAFRLDDLPHLCMDQKSPPAVLLVGDSPMVISQGTKFVDPGVTLVDEDTGDLKRRFETEYDEANHLNHKSGFVKTCGSYHVEYTLNTPWITGRPKASASRAVQVVNVDECSYDGDDADFKHTCVGLATCADLSCSSGDEAVYPGLGFDCVCLDEGYEPDGAYGCADKRPPVIECADAGCDYANIFAMKGDGAVLEHPRSATLKAEEVYYESEVDDAWAQATIDALPAPLLTAYDMQPAEHGDDTKVDLTGAITKGELTKTGEETWAQAYHVQDADGNAFTLSKYFTVTAVTPELLLPLVETLRSPELLKLAAEAEKPVAAIPDPADEKPKAVATAATPSDMSALSMALYATAAVVASWLVVGAMLRLLTAAQCLVLPGSMRHQRGRFDAGMDTLLSLQSLGTLTPAERKKLADAKWDEIIND